MRPSTTRTLCTGFVALAVAGCASASKAVDGARNPADHRAEAVTYPNIADIPAKPTPLDNSEQRKQAVQALQADRAQVDAQATDLRNQAAAMPPVTVPGQAPQPAPPAAPRPAHPK